MHGEAGVVDASAGFLRALRQLCDQHGLLLILDQVQTGIARCGSLLAHTHRGVAPDILTLGKDLGGGVPISVMPAREAVF